MASKFRYARKPETRDQFYVYRVFFHDDGAGKTSSQRLGLLERICDGWWVIVDDDDKDARYFSRNDAAMHLWLRMDEYTHPARLKHGLPYRPRIRRPRLEVHR